MSQKGHTLISWTVNGEGGEIYFETCKIDVSLAT